MNRHLLTKPLDSNFGKNDIVKLNMKEDPKQSLNMDTILGFWQQMTDEIDKDETMTAAKKEKEREELKVDVVDLLGDFWAHYHIKTRG